MINVNVTGPNGSGQYSAVAIRQNRKSLVVSGLSRLGALDALCMFLEAELDLARGAYVAARSSFHEEMMKVQKEAPDGEGPKRILFENKEGN